MRFTKIGITPTENFHLEHKWFFETRSETTEYQTQITKLAFHLGQIFVGIHLWLS